MAPTRSASRRAATAQASADDEAESPVIVSESPAQKSRNKVFAPKASDAVFHSNGVEISMYEKARLENIRRNEEFLAELGVSALRPTPMTSNVRRVTTTTKSFVKDKTPAMPTRRSSRVTSEKLVSEIKLLMEKGDERTATAKQKELDDFLAAKQTPMESYFPTEQDREPYQRLTEPVPLRYIHLLFAKQRRQQNKEEEENGKDDEEEQVEEDKEKDEKDNSIDLTSLLHSFSVANSSFVIKDDLSSPSTSHANSKRAKAYNKKNASTHSSGCFYEDNNNTTSFIDDDTIFNDLHLQERDVARLCPQRMTCVALHPSPHKLLAAGGDKNGVLSLWDVDHSEPNTVYVYKPHISNVTKLFFPFTGSSGALATCQSNSSGQAAGHSLYSLSYDGTVRGLDLQTETFALSFSAPESLDAIYYTDAVFCPGTVSQLLVSKSNGGISGVDLRVSDTAYTWSAEVCPGEGLGKVKVSSVDVHPRDTSVVLCATSKHGILMHDMRMLTATGGSRKVKPLAHFEPHNKAINACYFAPSGDYCVSVSLDDTVKTFSCHADNLGSNSQILGSKCPRSETPVSFDHLHDNRYVDTLRHNNFTGRWLSTFKPAFDPKRPATFAMGSMLQPRRIEIYSVKNSNSNSKRAFSVDLVGNLTSDYLASVNSRLCFHASVEAVLGSNSSGKVHLFR